MKSAAPNILVSIDYRGAARFGCDYALACRLCDALLEEGQRAVLFNINASLDRILSRWKDSIIFVLADTFSPESINAKYCAQPFGLRKALESAGRTFVGSTFEAVCRSSSANKITARNLLKKNVRVPPAVVVQTAGDLRQKARHLAVNLGMPSIIKKPLMTGCSVGVHYCESTQELEQVLGQFRRDKVRRVLVEKWISGREFTTWVIERRGVARCYGTEEIFIPRDEPILTGAGKKLAVPFDGKTPPSDRPCFECPPRLSRSMLAMVEETALEAHRKLQLRHYSRVDMILHKCAPFVIDVNARPQLRDGGLGYVAAKRGESFGHVLASLVEEARHAKSRERRAHEAILHS